jgi:hypothetical protein
MNKKSLVTFLVLLCISFLSLFSANSVMADNFPITPAVTKCSISPVDLPLSGGQVTVSIHIVSLNGVYSGVTAVTDNVNKSGENLFIGPLARINGTAQDGDWQASFQISNNRTPGNYRLSLYPVKDVQGINDGYIHCDTQIVNYGVPPLGISGTTSTTPTPTVTITATPAPAPTVTITATPAPAPTVFVANPADKPMSDLIISLKSQVALLNSKLKKICAVKPRPKAC